MRLDSNHLASTTFSGKEDRPPCFSNRRGYRQRDKQLQFLTSSPLPIPHKMANARRHCLFVQPRRIDGQSVPHENPRIQRVGNDRERDIGSGNLDAHSREVARPSEKGLLMRTRRTNLVEKKVQFQGRILTHSKFRD